LGIPIWCGLSFPGAAVDLGIVELWNVAIVAPGPRQEIRTGSPSRRRAKPRTVDCRISKCFDHKNVLLEAWKVQSRGRILTGERIMYSHPIASANCSIGVWCIDSVGTAWAFNDLAALAGDGSRLAPGERSTSSSSSIIGTSLLLGLFLFESLLFLACCLLRGRLVGSSNDRLGILLVFVDSPIKDVVILEPFSNEEITEDFSKVRVVGLVVESKRASVVEIDGELVGEATAEDFGRGGHLLFHDAVVLLFLGGSLQSLPWK
jgi:hypothetical protein